MKVMGVKDFEYWARLKKEAEKAWDKFEASENYRMRASTMHGPLLSMFRSLAREFYIKGYMKGKNINNKEAQA